MKEERAKVKQTEINKYTMGCLQLPLQDRKQIEFMIILHYGIPDKKASEMVGKALILALEHYRRIEAKQRNEIAATHHMIANLENWTPELIPNSPGKGARGK